MKTTASFEETIETMILYGYLWDTLWLPVEMKTRQEIHDILKNTWISWEKIQSFLPPTLHWLYLAEKENPLARAVSSDDTYTSRAFVQSVWQTWVLNWDDITQKLLRSFEEHPFGYGWSTKWAYKNLKEGISFQESWTPWWGNGTVMKLASFTAYLLSQDLSEEKIWEHIRTFCSITHTHESVILGTYIHHRILWFLISHDSIEEMIPFLEELLSFTQKKETVTDTISLSSVLEKLLWYLKDGKIYEFSDEEILQYFGWGEHPITKFSGRIDITLGLCYALFLRNPSYSCLFDAVSLWGDTDSYGTIVGNMVAAFSWNNWMLDDLLESIPEIEIIKQETQRFIQSMRRQSRS